MKDNLRETEISDSFIKLTTNPSKQTHFILNIIVHLF